MYHIMLYDIVLEHVVVVLSNSLLYGDIVLCDMVAYHIVGVCVYKHV